MKNVPYDAVSENNQLHVAHLSRVAALQQFRDECVWFWASWSSKYVYHTKRFAPINEKCNKFGIDLPADLLATDCMAKYVYHTKRFAPINEKCYKFGIDLPADLLATDCMAKFLCFVVISMSTALM